MGFANRVRIVKSYLNKQSISSGYPTEVVLELCRKCNYSCTMCFTPFLKGDQGIMQPEVFEKIIPQISPYTEMIYLSGRGEPLLNPNVVDYVKTIKKQNIPVGLATNCSLLTPKKSEELLSSGLDYIMIPLDGISKKTYESIRINGDFDLVINNLKQFLEIKKKVKSKTFVQVLMISLPENQHEQQEFQNFVRKLDIYNQVTDVRKKPEINYSHQEEGWNNIFRPCFLLWRNLYISWNAVAFACSQDSQGAMQIGDFKKQDLDEVWNSKAMQVQRKLHTEMKMHDNPVCDKCGLDQEYFKLPTIFAAIFFNTFQLKKNISFYEKNILREYAEAIHD